MMATHSPEQLATIDEFLKEDSDSEDEDDPQVASINMATVNVNDDEESGNDDSIIWPDPPSIDLRALAKVQASKATAPSLSQESNVTTPSMSQESTNTMASNDSNGNKKSKAEAEIDGIFQALDQKANNITVHLRGENAVKAHNLHVGEVHKKCIINNGADTSVIGQGWLVAEHTTRKANMIGFDSVHAVKKNLPIVTTISAVDNGDDTMLIGVHESILNESSPHSLLSDFQLRECVEQLDVVSKRHGGKQVLKPTTDSSIPLQMKECMMTFQVWIPTTHEIDNREIHWLTKDEVQNPKTFFDDPADEFFDCSNNNGDETVALIASKDHSDEDEFCDSVEEMTDREMFGKPVHLDIDTSRGIFVRSSQVDHILNQIPMDELISTNADKWPENHAINFFGQLPDDAPPPATNSLHRAHPAKVDCDQLSPHFAFMQSDVICETFKRTITLPIPTKIGPSPTRFQGGRQWTFHICCFSAGFNPFHAWTQMPSSQKAKRNLDILWGLMSVPAMH